MKLSLLILWMTAGVYAAAFGLHLVSFSSTHERGHKTAYSLLRLGFLLSTFYFAAEAVDSRSFLPIGNLSKAMAFFAWSLGFVYLVLFSKTQSDSFGVVLNPVLTLLVVIACMTFGRPSHIPDLADHPLFTVHIVSAFFAYACFAISFAAGVLFLIQNRELKEKKAGTFYHKLPSLEELEKLIYHPMRWGLFLLVSAVVIGLRWSKMAFGAYSLADPKTIVTLTAASIYIIILGVRQTFLIRGRQSAWFSILAFAVVLLGFVGTRFIDSSHYYLR